MSESEAVPKLVAVYGFLGSGKTTVMMNIAKTVVLRGRSAAIVVNEAGEVPVDGRLLEFAGLPVREIYSGCVCCSASGDFIRVLKTLSLHPSLDYILIEPSGMADAESFFISLRKHAALFARRVLILDGERLSLLLKAARPLIDSQVRNADLILVNKTDAMDEECVQQCDEYLRVASEKLPVFKICSRNGVAEQVKRAILDYV